MLYQTDLPIWAFGLHVSIHRILSETQPSIPELGSSSWLETEKYGEGVQGIPSFASVLSGSHVNKQGPSFAAVLNDSLRPCEIGVPLRIAMQHYPQLWLLCWVLVDVDLAVSFTKNYYWKRKTHDEENIMERVFGMSLDLGDTFGDLDDELPPGGACRFGPLIWKLKIQAWTTVRESGRPKRSKARIVEEQPTIDRPERDSGLQTEINDFSYWVRGSTTLPTMWVFASRSLEDTRILLSEEQIVSVDIPRVGGRCSGGPPIHSFIDFRARWRLQVCYLLILKELSLLGVGVGPAVTFDHHPLLLSLSKLRNEGPRPFRFQSMWLLNKDFKSFVQNIWDEAVTGSAFHRVIAKLKRFGFATNFAHGSVDFNIAKIWVTLMGFGGLLWLFTEGSQGDPLSPLLFGIAEDFFSRFLSRMVSQSSLLPISSPRNFSSPTHLLYDDVLMFVEDLSNLIGVLMLRLSDSFRVGLSTWTNLISILVLASLTSVDPRFWRTLVSKLGHFLSFISGYPFLKEAYSVFSPYRGRFGAISLLERPHSFMAGRLCLINFGDYLKFVHTFMILNGCGFLKSLNGLLNFLWTDLYWLNRSGCLDERVCLIRPRAPFLVETFIFIFLMAPPFWVRYVWKTFIPPLGAWRLRNRFSSFLDLPLIGAIWNAGVLESIGCIVRWFMFERYGGFLKLSLDLWTRHCECTSTIREANAIESAMHIRLSDGAVAVAGPWMRGYFVTVGDSSRVSRDSGGIIYGESDSTTSSTLYIHSRGGSPWVYKSRWVKRLFMFPTFILGFIFGREIRLDLLSKIGFLFGVNGGGLPFLYPLHYECQWANYRFRK
ncbi:hypothetical protein FNV43_RR00273 [Rhamnella rubrinervis]|uniref:Uncharacterized protein n=1 Tax=Rhamnella rubrinervis TaxID=2594499 RepID=A0A8K0HND2_9ROSA|nr:hypothetical protein FNV43_RR00273 [Rhamnella rubrinervis]